MFKKSWNCNAFFVKIVLILFCFYKKRKFVCTLSWSNVKKKQFLFHYCNVNFETSQNDWNQKCWSMFQSNPWFRVSNGFLEQQLKQRKRVFKCILYCRVLKTSWQMAYLGLLCIIVETCIDLCRRLLKKIFFNSKL